MNSDHVYAYHQLHDMNTMEDQVWRIKCRVTHKGSVYVEKSLVHTSYYQVIMSTYDCI